MNTIRSWKSIHIAEGHGGGAAFSPDETLLVVSEPHCRVGLWELASGRRLRSFQGKYPVSYLAFFPDGKRFVGVSSSSAVILFGGVDEPGRVVSSGYPYADGLVVSPAGDWFSFVGCGPGIPILDTETGNVRRLLSLEDMPFEYFSYTAVALSPDGKTLVTSDDGGHDESVWGEFRGGGEAKIRAWNLETGENRPIGSGSASTLAFNADGSRLLIAGSGPNVRQVDGRTFNPIETSPIGRATCAAFLPGTGIVTYGQPLTGDEQRSASLRLWAEDGTQTADLSDQVEFGFGGRLAAGTSGTMFAVAEKGVWLWRASTYR